MVSRTVLALTFALVLVWIAVPTRALADEGMWLFNNPPREALRSRYGSEVTDAWLEHVQKSAVRFNSGGSGSFVSADGLVMTNHHIGMDTLQKLSTKEKDYVNDGFLARTRDREAKAVDLELNVLMEIVDVTDRVKAAVKSGTPPEEAFKARRAVTAQIEKESQDKTGFRSNVISLYQGGKYHLYRFKRYTDVRLVFAPEQQIAFFGGDPDNFEYPRYNLDVCIFRVYENGQPVKPQHYLKWSKAGPARNELVFVAGHPGRTERLLTAAELETLRDREWPYQLQRLYRREVNLLVFSGRSLENARRAKDELFSVQNNRKRREGNLAGLLDPALWAAKLEAEKKFKEALLKNRSLKSTMKAFDRIAQAQKVRMARLTDHVLLEGGAAFDSVLFEVARTLVRAAQERARPNEQRLEEYSESERPSLELRLFSKRPIYDDLESAKLAHSLAFLAEQLGAGHPLVQKVLAGKSPRARAAELVTGSRLKDVESRRALYDGGAKAIASSGDPMIALARAVDPEARAVRKVFDTQVMEVKRQAYDQIAGAKFALEGPNSYPDATFTLRLTFGVAKGYDENGKEIPFAVPITGLYERASDQKNTPPFDLPLPWVRCQKTLDATIPFNFVATTDTIGGNSGSPVVNRAGELVGLIFDSNLHALVRAFIYTEVRARSIAVHSSAILEALRKVYGADSLAAELTGGK
ncbi:MAG: S46 family peptidase [Candidatus Riflebacteria bacterium]|nr:S46 family peptidase [Candidatus Riflebacteria bacterium]